MNISRLKKECRLQNLHFTENLRQRRLSTMFDCQMIFRKSGADIHNPWTHTFTTANTKSIVIAFVFCPNHQNVFCLVTVFCLELNNNVVILKTKGCISITLPQYIAWG